MGDRGFGGECSSQSVKGRTEWDLCTWSMPQPCTPQLELCSLVGGGLGAREWNLEGGPREGMAVGGGEAAWGSRREGLHGKEGWWRKPGPPGKWSTIVEWSAIGRASMVAPFPTRWPNHLGQWHGCTPDWAHPPLKPGSPPPAQALLSLLGSWV